MSILEKPDRNIKARAVQGEIPIQSRYTYGLAGEKFFRAIMDKALLLGTRCDECDYTYVPLTREEVHKLIDVGLNCLRVDDEREEWVFRKPVFYYKQFRENSRANYPEILYRSNYRGAVVFIDEPEIHILKDREDLAKIKRPEEGAYLITKRLEQIWDRPAERERRRGLGPSADS